MHLTNTPFGVLPVQAAFPLELLCLRETVTLPFELDTTTLFFAGSKLPTLRPTALHVHPAAWAGRNEAAFKAIRTPTTIADLFIYVSFHRGLKYIFGLKAVTFCDCVS